MAMYSDDTVHHDHVVHEDRSGSNSLVGLALAIIVILALLYFGLPLLRGAFAVPQVITPSINVPSQGTLDVNVNQK